MKPSTLAALDRAMDFPLAAAAGLALGLAGAFLASLTPPDHSPAVSTSASAFRSAGRGEAAGDSFPPAPQETDQTMHTPLHVLVDARFLAALARLESGNQPTAVNRREDAPARNCDRYATAKDALDAFIREKEIIAADVDNMNLRDFFDWLFAPTEE